MAGGARRNATGGPTGGGAGTAGRGRTWPARWHRPRPAVQSRFAWSRLIPGYAWARIPESFFGSQAVISSVCTTG